MSIINSVSVASKKFTFHNHEELVSRQLRQVLWSQYDAPQTKFATPIKLPQNVLTFENYWIIFPAVTISSNFKPQKIRKLELWVLTRFVCPEDRSIVDTCILFYIYLPGNQPDKFNFINLKSSQTIFPLLILCNASYIKTNLSCEGGRYRWMKYWQLTISISCLYRIT